jgi:hypothetical protein
VPMADQINAASVSTVSSSQPARRRARAGSGGGVVAEGSGAMGVAFIRCSHFDDGGSPAAPKVRRKRLRGVRVKAIQLGVGECVRGAVEDNPPGAQANVAPGKPAREFRLMQRHDQRGVMVCLDRRKEFQHVSGPGGIEARNGFIGEDEFGFLREGAGDSHTLLLASTQGVRPLVDFARKAGFNDRRPRGSQILRGEPAKERTPSVGVAEPSAERVLQNAQALHEAKLLVDERHALVRRAASSLACARQVDAEDFDLAGAWLDESLEAAEKRALARAARPNDGDTFARLDTQCFEREQGSSAPVGNFDMPDLDQADVPGDYGLEEPAENSPGFFTKP